MKPSFITATSTLLALLVTSVMVHAAQSPDPNPSPSPSPTYTPPPPPKYCDSPRTYSYSGLPERSNAPYSFTTSKTEAGEDWEMDCAAIKQYDGVRYISGKLRVACKKDFFSGDASWANNPSNSCNDDDLEASCQTYAVSGIGKAELSAIYQNASYQKQQEDRSVLKSIPNGTQAQANIARVTAACWATFKSDGAPADLDAEGSLQPNVPRCSSSNSNICYIDPYEILNDNFKYKQSAKANVVDKNNGKKPIFYVLNRSNNKDNIPDGAVTWVSHYHKGGEWRGNTQTPLGSVAMGGVASEATSCELKVSGAISSYTISNPPKVLVDNDVLVFTVNLKGGIGAISPPKVTFSGGPNPVTGVWDNPPSNTESTVTASVETAVSKNKFTCSLTIDPQGNTDVVRLRRFGDCSYFDSLRTYYFNNAKNTAAQSGPYSPRPLSIPGISAKYGMSRPEVPYAGVLNGAASLAGEIILNSSGQVVMPPLSKRAYSKAVIVGKRFQKGEVADPVYYGLMDLNDYSLTRLRRVDPNQVLADDETIVFQAYLAAVQPDAGFTRDFRGTAEGLPYFLFTPSTSNGRPYDRIIPFANEACIPLFQASPPKREDKEYPADLANVVQCLYTRPYKVADVKSGRMDLTLMHLVPEHPQHQFPTELLKASAQPACVAKNPGNTKKCWDVKAANFGVAANADPFTSHEACRTVTTSWITQTTNSEGKTCTYHPGSGNSGGGYTTCVKTTTTATTRIPVTTVSYNPSCPVLESKSECSKNVAIRFSGYNQMMIAALGCAATGDPAGERPNELISAALINQGILPYAASPLLGGSAPLPYTSYQPGYSGTRKGYACIPCRFGNDATAAGHDLIAETAALPVDQDSTSARKAVFSFRKLSAPAECVRDVTFEVRYFGASDCGGVNASSTHFCSSSNLGGQSCGATDGKGAGNVAGKFTIPVCPNSGFEFDNVSVSWSPLLLDLAGTGIEVTRDPQYGVKFDILGDGKSRLIDWPLNTNEVAFLVLPNKAGKVVSGKELFGQYKSKDGFAALGKYDKNKDLKIDKNDKIYDSLRLWFDRNRNGVQEDGELATLADQGVETIYLEHRKILNKGTDGRTLSSVYYNSKYREYLNVGDYYFNEYSKPQKKK